MRSNRIPAITAPVEFIKNSWIGISALLLILITVLSLLPLAKLPPSPGGDKFHHVVAYMLLAIPAALRKPRRWVVVCIAFIAYSGIIELLQPFVNRYCDGVDMLANTTGVVCGILIAGLVNTLFRAGSSTR